MTIARFEGTILNRLSQLFDKYVDILIKALPGTSEEDNLPEQKEAMHFRDETDAQQLALLGTAFTVADELLLMVESRICNPPNENKETGSGPSENTIANITAEFKDWRRRLQHSLDKLRDHFCRQYVLNFIYPREGKTRLDARMYLNGKAGDLFWDSDPLPSLPFQVFFFLFFFEWSFRVFFIVFHFYFWSDACAEIRVVCSGLPSLAFALKHSICFVKPLRTVMIAMHSI